MDHLWMRLVPLILFWLTCSGLSGLAQAPGVPVEEPEDWNGDPNIISQAAGLLKAGKLIGMEAFGERLRQPIPEKIELPATKTAPLNPPEIYEVARFSRVRIGWYYLCRDCAKWHTDLAGGYPLTENGVIATCYHVVTPTDDMKEGYLIVVDGAGRVHPVTGVIASSEKMDTCLLRAGSGPFHAIPLNDQVRPGDAAYCLSDPMGNNGYFSEGIVNRFYRLPGGPGTPVENLRINVSTDWAPGSSGSPVLDQCGNAIGHVSTISSITEDPEEPSSITADADSDPKSSEHRDASGDKPNTEEEAPLPPGTQIILHEACASRSVWQLVQATNAAVSAGTRHSPAPPVKPLLPRQAEGTQ